MYFNLHFLQEKENNLQAIYEYFSSEKEYLFLDDKILEQINNYLSINININGNYIQILMGIINILKDTKVILIFDQYKKRNSLYYILNSFFDEVKEKKYKIKFILCSSINGDEIKEEVIKTIENNKGMPRYLIDFTQHFFFYMIFEPRIKSNDLYNPIYEFFNFLPKYKSQFKNKKDEKFNI